MARTPLYQSLAETLGRRIADGTYAVGGLLPTEWEICRQEGMSRHTVREALRQLIEAGLVERRQGAGTRVIAARQRPAFIQPLGGPQELMQYARDARLVVGAISERALNEDEAARLEITVGPKWLVVEGLRRRADGEVLAATQLFVAPPFVAIGPELRGWAGAVQELIAQRFEVQVAWISQRIAAECLDVPMAERLNAEPGAAALRTLRRYYDADEALIVASDSLHPADRFAYEMDYRREG